MRRLCLLAAATGIAVSAFAAMSPAEASFHLIRWQDSGFCQIWDQSVPTVPYPGQLHRRHQQRSADLRRRAGAQGRPAAQRHLLVLIAR